MTNIALLAFALPEAPPLAAADDWIKLALPIIVGIFYLISWINEQMKAANKKKPPVRPPAPARPAAPNQPKAQQPRSIEDELNEFLRRAAQRKGEKPTPQRVEAAEGNPMIQRERPSQQGSSQQRPSQQGRPGQSPSRPRPAPQRTSQQPRPEKARPAQRPLSQQEATPQREARIGETTLGKSVDDRSEAMQSHLKQIFEHSLGSLAQPASSSPASAASPDSAPIDAKQLSAADTIATILRNPEQARSAIILNEILTRPEHRW